MDNAERELLESGRPVQIFHIGSVGQMNPSATTVTNHYYGDQFVPKEEGDADDRRQVPQDEEHGGEQSAQTELFHFIHPSVTPAEEQVIHSQVQRLVRRFGIQEICRFLTEMKNNQKLLLPQGVKIVYDELKRMGLPADGEGFDYKTFAKYYKN